MVIVGSVVSKVRVAKGFGKDRNGFQKVSQKVRRVQTSRISWRLLLKSVELSLSIKPNTPDSMLVD
jgi:hypothetical protein